MPFNFHPLAIPDVILIEPRVLGDSRGFFIEIYKRSEFAAAGITDVFTQANHSGSEGGVLRGLHYQRPPHAQSKLIRVVSGRVFDVAVDLRPDSPTNGRWVGAHLSAEDRRQMYIPAGCAHGFCVLSDHAEVVYLMSTEYAPEYESGIRWDDPAIGIKWPIDRPVLSERDTKWPLLASGPGASGTFTE
jgi:dTDP-4-dehydrorhamnose 3,5-epimerase